MSKIINPKNPLRKQVPTAQPMGKTASTSPVLKTFRDRADEQTFGGDGQVNPLRYAGQSDSYGNGVRQALKAGSRDRIYNASGEINAYDNKDAIAQAGHVLSRIAGSSPLTRMVRTASSEEKAEQRKILAVAMSTKEGFELVGQELALPIKIQVDYKGWGRQILRQRSIAQGELFRMATDVRVPAFVIAQDGQAVESRIGVKYIQPDFTKIVADFSVDIETIYHANYDVLERGQETAAQEISREEDRRVQALLSRASSEANTVSNFASVSLSVFENLRYQVEQHSLICDKFLMHRKQLSEVQINMSGNMDPVTQRELNLAGYIGRILGAYILIASGTGDAQQVVPAGTMYAVAAPEYLGEMGIVVELFSQAYDKAVLRETARGWMFTELLGMAIGNARSVAKAVKSV